MTDELKALLKAAKTEEEAKEILLANKSELSDEELEQINGGGGFKDFCKTFRTVLIRFCINSIINCTKD